MAILFEGMYKHGLQKPSCKRILLDDLNTLIGEN